MICMEKLPQQPEASSVPHRMRIVPGKTNGFNGFVREAAVTLGVVR